MDEVKFVLANLLKKNNVNDDQNKKEFSFTNKNKNNTISENSSDPSVYQVNNINIRTNWLFGTEYDKRIITKQAFLFIMAQNDYNLAVENNFPLDMIGRLKDNLLYVRSNEFYNELIKTDNHLLSNIEDKYNLKQCVTLMQVKDSYDETTDFIKILIKDKGIYIIDSFNNEDILKYDLLSIEEQFMPIYPRLHRKLYKGTLGWYTKIGNMECKYRLLLKFGVSQEDSANRAIYFNDLNQLHRVKNAFIVFDKKALSAKNMLKFMASRWKVQNSDYFFSKLYAFNIKSLQARNINTKLLKTLKLENEPIDSQKRFKLTLNNEPDYIYPFIVIIPNITDNFIKVIPYEYTFAESTGKELQKFTIEYYYENMIDFNNTKYGIFTSRGEKIEMDDIIFNSSVELLITVKANYKTPKSQEFKIKREKFLHQRYFSNLLMIQEKTALINFIFIRNSKDILITDHSYQFKTLFSIGTINWRPLSEMAMIELCKTLFNKNNKLLVYSNNINIVLEHIKINECLENAENILYIYNMVRLYLSEYDIKLLEKFIGADLSSRLIKFCESQSSFLSDKQGEFKNTLALAMLTIPLELKFQAFEILLSHKRFNFLQDIPKFKDSNHLYDFYMNTLRRKLKFTNNDKNFVISAQSRYANRICELYFYCNEHPSLVQLLFVNQIFFSNEFNDLRIDNLNRVFFTKAFVQIFITKVYIKNKFGILYEHIINIGASIEDLLLYHILTDYVELYTINMFYIIRDIKSIFMLCHSKTYLFELLIDLYALDIFLTDCEKALLACQTNSELFNTFQNLCANYGYSDHCSKSKHFSKRLIDKIFSFIEEKDKLIETENKNEIFQSLENLETYYRNTYSNINKSYQDIEFKYFNISEVEKFFYEFESKVKKISTSKNKSLPNKKDTVPKDSQLIDDTETSGLIDSRYAPFRNDISMTESNKIDNIDVNNFYPHNVNFHEIKEPCKIVLRFKAINSLLLEKKNVNLDEYIKIECNTGSSEKIISIYNVLSGAFDSGTDSFEISIKSNEQTLFFTLEYKNIAFTSILPLALYYTNCIETVNLPLFNKHYGVIFVNIIFSIQNKQHFNLSDYHMIDIAEEFCLDRKFGYQSVYKHPVVVEFNSLVQKYYIEYEFKPKLKGKDSAKSIYRFALDEMQKYYSNDNLTFPIVKIIIYLALNSVDSRSNGLLNKIELIWNVLTNFEQSNEFLQLETVKYLIESLLMNYMPFVPNFIASNMAERIFVGYTGNICRATLLDENMVDIIDITQITRNLVLQNQIYQNKRLLNFLKEDIIAYISQQIKLEIKDFNLASIKYIKLSYFNNNAMSRVIIKLKLKHESTVDYFFRKKAEYIVDLTNQLLIDKQTFITTIHSDPLLTFLLHGELDHDSKEHIEIPQLIPLKIADFNVFGTKVCHTQNKIYKHLGKNIMLINNNALSPYPYE